MDTSTLFHVTFVKSNIFLNGLAVPDPDLDPEQYKAGQRQGWDSVADGWQNWWKTTETAGEKVSRRLIGLQC